LYEKAAGKPHDLELRIEVAYRSHDALGQLGIACGLVVEGAVRFHMREFAALCPDHRIQRANLVQQAGTDRGQRQVHFPATKIGAVRKAGMRANGYVAPARGAHQRQHVVRAAGMPGTGDIDRGHTVQQCRIIAAALAQVGIEVNVHAGSAAGAASSLAAGATLTGRQVRVQGSNRIDMPGATWASRHWSAAITQPILG
jgi:hypothetical protein